MKDPKPYRVSFGGMSGVVWERNAGKARYAAALSAKEAGWMIKADPSQIRCRREKSLDHIAQAETGRVYSYDHFSVCLEINDE